jgi:transcriptional regulator with XRE-family HTH domain
MVITTDFPTWFKKRLATIDMQGKILAVKSGVAESEISRIASGVRQASPKTLAKLAPHLKMDVRELMEIAGILPTSDERETSSIQITRRSVEGRFVDASGIDEDLPNDIRGACAVQIKGNQPIAPDGATVVYNPDIKPVFGDTVYAKLKNDGEFFAKYMSVNSEFSARIMKVVTVANPAPIMLMPIDAHNSEPILTTNDKLEFIYKVVAIHLP